MKMNSVVCLLIAFAMCVCVYGQVVPDPSKRCYGFHDDPHFVGLQGQQYDFQGQPDKMFHIYSDPFCSLNAHFIQLDNRKGASVVDAVGLRIGRDVSIIFEVPAKGHSHGAVNVTVSYDLDLSSGPVTKIITLENGARRTTECGLVMWEYPMLTVLFDDYLLQVQVKNYLNVHFAPPESRRSPNAKNGGIIGVTNQPGLPSVNASLYILAEDDLLSVKAPNIQFSLQNAPQFLTNNPQCALALTRANPQEQKGQAVRAAGTDCATKCQTTGGMLTCNCYPDPTCCGPSPCCICDLSNPRNQAACDTCNGCFPEDSTVTTPSGPKRMAELDAGDLVLDGDGKFTPVLMFLERGQFFETNYVRVVYHDGNKLSALELTATHVLAIAGEDGKPKFIDADKLQVGQLVFLHGLVTVPVVELQRVKSRGAYVPLTFSGTLLVDGVYVSCFAGVSHEFGMITTIPSRWIASYLPASFFKHQGQSYFNTVARVFAATFGRFLDMPSLHSTPTGKEAMMMANTKQIPSFTEPQSALLHVVS